MNNSSVNQSEKLRLVSYLAPNMFEFYEAVRAYISRVLGVETVLVQSQCSPLEDPMLLDEQLDLAFICGLPFARHYQVVSEQLQALVAPVMQAERYGDRPIYFSDVIVNADSDWMSLDELADQTLCYNDLGSNSGYNLLHHRLFEASYPSGFFSKVIQSGSHQRSIHWVVEGLADCSAIDSTVLEQELRNAPDLLHRLRVIESIGPCPMPPIVAARHLGSAKLEQIQKALLQPDLPLQAAMAKARIRHYATVQSEDYMPLAMMCDATVRAGYELVSA